MKLVHGFRSLLNDWRQYISSNSVRSIGQPWLYNIESTNRCPMTCRMCPRSKMTRPLCNIDINLFHSAVQQTAKVTRMVWLDHFGDPLLNPQLPELIAIAKAYGVGTGVSVNPGSLSSEMAHRLLSSGLDHLHFSLDGIDEETYRYYRGPAADYARAVARIEEFLRLKQAASVSRPFVVIAMVCMLRTQSQIDEFRRRWTRPGVDQVMLKPYCAFNGDVDNSGEPPLPRPPGPLSPCYFPWSSVTVMSDGRVVPCCYDYDGLFVLGDLSRQTIVDIWNGEAMRRLRQSHLSGHYEENQLCRNCVDRRLRPDVKTLCKQTGSALKTTLRSAYDLDASYR